MKFQLKHLFSYVLIACMSMLTSCTVVGGIFKAGVWSGIIIVVVIIAVIIFIISKFASGSGK